MLKLVPRPVRTPARQRKSAQARQEVRLLYRQADAQRRSGEGTQRAVARARSTIVEALCRAPRAADVSCRAGTPGTAAMRGRRIAHLARRVDEIHQRLLALSSSVEVEMDRLEITCAEIDQAARALPECDSQAHPGDRILQTGD